MSWIDRFRDAGRWVMDSGIDAQIDNRVREEVGHRLAAAEEQRAITELPWNTGAPSTASSTTNPARALKLAPVYGAVSMIARSIASLPLHSYRKTGATERQKLPNLPQLFTQPSVHGELTDWLHRAMMSLLLHGNAYGLITARDGFGYPTMIEWLDPLQMWIIDENLWGRGSFFDPIYYWRGREIAQENLLHIPWFSVPFRVRGLSPMGAYAAAVDLGLSGQDFVNDWYNSGGVPPGTFQNKEKKVTKDEADEIRGRLTNSIRTHEPLVYGADWQYNATSITPQEAHFVESHQMSATDIAVVYGIYPPERIGGAGGSSMTYANVEAEQIQWVNITLLPYVTKLESHFFGLLPQPQYVKFDLDSQIRSDMKTRHEVYQLDREIGLNNIDELRAKEDLAPLPNKQGQDYNPLVVVREMVRAEPSKDFPSPESPGFEAGPIATPGTGQEQPGVGGGQAAPPNGKAGAKSAVGRSESGQEFEGAAGPYYRVLALRADSDEERTALEQSISKSAPTEESVKEPASAGESKNGRHKP